MNIYVDEHGEFRINGEDLNCKELLQEAITRAEKLGNFLGRNGYDEELGLADDIAGLLYTLGNTLGLDLEQ